MSTKINECLKSHSHSVLTESNRLPANNNPPLFLRHVAQRNAGAPSRREESSKRTSYDIGFGLRNAGNGGAVTRSLCAEMRNMNKRWARILGMFVAAGALCCPGATPARQERALPDSGKANIVLPSAHSDTDQIQPAERDPRYRICRDDVLVISFPLTPELNQKVFVQPDGFISLQSAGNIRIEGLTVPGVVEAVKKAYAGTLHSPIVDVDLVDFQKPFFTVLGQVGKPGQYDLRYDTTVTQAIAVAGGFAASAKTQVLLYRSVSSNWAEVHQFKIKDILNGKNIGEDAHLRPGDMIFVPENAITKFRKYVPYSLGFSSVYPGAY